MNRISFFVALLIALFAITAPVVYAQTKGYENGHEWVDLGLPSGALWARTNLGAASETGYGDYFAWGETNKKTSYHWSKYKYYDSDQHPTKYSVFKPHKDDKVVLETIDDAAYVQWGSSWCTPRKKDYAELLAYCSYSFTTINGINGYRFVGKNGNSIFFPAAGFMSGDELRNVGLGGYYYTADLINDFGTSDDNPAQFVFYTPNNVIRSGNPGFRSDGCTVRPILRSRASVYVSQSSSKKGGIDKGEKQYPYSETRIDEHGHKTVSTYHSNGLVHVESDISCFSCQGRGKCGMCQGLGYFPYGVCTSCNGNGICRFCGGKGVTSLTYDYNRNDAPPSSGNNQLDPVNSAPPAGSILVTCPTCGGSGKGPDEKKYTVISSESIWCSICREYSSPHSHGPSICRTCSGSGKILR